MKKRITSRKFGKSTAHRKAMMSNMASSLIEHKRIKTTHQKALELRKFIEPMITKAKNQSLHNRREVMKKIHNSDAVKTLFDVIAPVYSDRPGGYTRIIKLGTRTNDAAKISLIEFVDKAQFKVDEVADSDVEEVATEEDS
ncbi:MAG: 50S ribosomal protein L17 [Candidatus Neomarinimicrobiota bacterium]